MRVEEVASPQSMAEALAFLKRHPDAVPWAGGTLLMAGEDRDTGGRPVSILDLRRIPELSVVNRSDRYLELGAYVQLSAILALPANLALDPLREAIRLIGTASVRNLATIGGNIAARGTFMTCFAALACMDAAIEIRDHSGSRWIGIHDLIGEDGRPDFPGAAILSRVRIPTLPWDAAVVRRLGSPVRGETHAASFAAAARFEKGTLSELRLVAAGKIMVRDRTLELSLVGKRLPLAARDIEAAESASAAKALELGFDHPRAMRYGAYVGAFLVGAQEET